MSVSQRLMEGFAVLRIRDVLFECRVFLLRRYSFSTSGSLSVGLELFARKRTRESDDVVTRGLAVFSSDVALIDASALIAQSMSRYAEARRRWERAIRPDFPLAWAGVACCARECGQLADASDFITEAIRRFPNDVTVISEAARVADKSGRHGDAQALWLKILDLPDAHPDWYEAYCYCLTAMREFDDAQATIDYAWTTHPGHRGIAAARGHLAIAREDWLHAITIWDDYVARYPDDATGHEHLEHAKEALDREKAQGMQFRLIPPHVPVVEDEAIRSMMLRFESLGEDCEFGVVQRRFGAEPLQLFRWSGCSVDTMLRAVSLRFEGIGDPDNTAIKSTGIEYYIEDIRYGFITHTWITENQADKEELHRKMCRRLAWLKEKTLEDMQAGHKVFVLKTQSDDLEKIKLLHDACLQIGPISLLCVVPKSCAMCASLPLNNPGDTNLIRPNLYVGVVDRAGTWSDGGWNVAYDDWVSICRGVLASRSSDTPALTG